MKKIEELIKKYKEIYERIPEGKRKIIEKVMNFICFYFMGLIYGILIILFILFFFSFVVWDSGVITFFFNEIWGYLFRLVAGICLLISICMCSDDW